MAELTELSSNWKNLQAKIKKDDLSNPPKRKVRSNTSERSGANEYRRQRLNSRAMTPRRPKSSSGGKIESQDGVDVSMSDAPPPSEEASKPVEFDSNLPSINFGFNPNVEIGKYVAIDCENVGVAGPPVNSSALARVSIVNYHGIPIYDSYVRIKQRITDYRTRISGIRPRNVSAEGRDLDEVLRDVNQILEGRIIVGHAIQNDFTSLGMHYPGWSVRDTTRLERYRRLTGGRTPGLKTLSKLVLGLEIQQGEHSSIVDARATMMLYQRYKAEFEAQYARKYGLRTMQATAARKGAPQTKSGKKRPKKRAKKGRPGQAKEVTMKEG
ncbi:MAG: 3'-5' exonuclease [Vezdaea acicularis]|nr:MAG: 3'-5' exonuclease [Vezdaea acicularis]